MEPSFPGDLPRVVSSSSSPAFIFASHTFRVFRSRRSSSAAYDGSFRALGPRLPTGDSGLFFCLRMPDMDGDLDDDPLGDRPLLRASSFSCWYRRWLAASHLLHASSSSSLDSTVGCGDGHGRGSALLDFGPIELASGGIGGGAVGDIGVQRTSASLTWPSTIFSDMNKFS